MINIVRTIKRDDLITTFCKKGFQTNQGKGEITLFFAYNNKATAYRTHCSRGAKGKILEPFHIKAMAKQLNLTEAEFMGIFSCSISKQGFIDIQKKNRGIDPLDIL